METVRYNAVAARVEVASFLDLYTEVYGVEPYATDPFFSLKRYDERLHGAIAMPGFEIVAAKADGRIVGTAHGVTLPHEIAWWQSLQGTLPDHLKSAAVQGNVFWLRELMVRPAYRNKGLGKQLHDALLSERRETLSTLTVIVDNEPARSAYLRWGYQIIGTVRHAPESPVYEAMTRARAS
jgi:GNAT superfamily N-acetyltransferase